MAVQAQKFYLTTQGKFKYENDLASLYRYLQRVARRMKLLRRRNNLEEDGDWEYTQNEYDYVSRRIDEIEDVLEHSRIIPQARSNVVALGSDIQCQNPTGTHKFVLVDAPEANPEEGKISIKSMLGRALLGKKVNDEVKINPPAGLVSYRIISVS